MPNEQQGFFSVIKRFIVGDTKRTAKSAATMNQIVDGLNALLAMQGTNGIRVVPSAAGYTIELDDKLKKELGMMPEMGANGAVTNPKGTLKFKGAWVPGSNYSAGDIFYRTGIQQSNLATTSSRIDGGVGMFLVSKDIVGATVPIDPELPPTSTYWELFSKGNCRYRGLYYNTEAYAANDVVLRPWYDAAYTAEAGLYVALKDVAANGTAATKANSSLADGDRSWDIVVNQSWVSPMFPTAATVGTAATGVQISPGQISLTVASATTGLFTGGALGGGTWDSGGFTCTTGAKTAALAVSLLPDGNQMAVRSITFLDGGGVPTTRQFFCTGP